MMIQCLFVAYLLRNTWVLTARGGEAFLLFAVPLGWGPAVMGRLLPPYACTHTQTHTDTRTHGHTHRHTGTHTHTDTHGHTHTSFTLLLKHDIGQLAKPLCGISCILSTNSTPTGCLLDHPPLSTPRALSNLIKHPCTHHATPLQS
jgi:hypothetical protein